MGFGPRLDPENVAFKTLAKLFTNRVAYEQAQRLGKAGQWPLQQGDYINWLPGILAVWTATRYMPAIPQQTFRSWWEARSKSMSNARENAFYSAFKARAGHKETPTAPQLEEQSTTGVLRNYHLRDEAPTEEILNRFIERVTEYKAIVRRVAEINSPWQLSRRWPHAV